MIAVAVPDFKFARQTAEQGRGMLLVDIEVRGAVLASLRANHFSAQRVCQPLHPITNSENGDAELQNFCVADRRVRVIDRTWAAGEHEADRFERANFFERSGARKNRGENLLLADAARDQLRVLPAEIEHDDSVAGAHNALGVRRFLRATGRLCATCGAAPVSGVIRFTSQPLLYRIARP